MTGSLLPRGHRVVRCSLCGARHRWPGERLRLLVQDERFRVWEHRTTSQGFTSSRGRFVQQAVKAGEFVCKGVHEKEGSDD